MYVTYVSKNIYSILYIYVKLKNITIIFYIKKIYFSFEKVIKVCSINHLCIKRKE